MSDNSSPNNQSSSNSQSSVNNPSSSSNNSLQGGEIEKKSSRLRHVDPQDTMTLLTEGFSQKNTD
jgi:hypothetical protein